ncbi:MAG: glycosyltransferase family 4 protein [Ardenticatenaceae bacterium]|nr:glycosyltransferase family 4 protein [Ardenticatenaceae bacterium]
MNILFVTLFFPPHRSAGTENYTLGIGKALNHHGHDVTVVCAGDWETGTSYFNGVTREQIDGLQIFRLNLNWTKASDPNKVLYYAPAIEEWFDNFLIDIQPDVIHVTSAITLGAGIIFAGRRAGIPVVLTLTDFWFLCPRIQLLKGDGELCDGLTSAAECRACLATDSRIMQQVNRYLPAGMSRHLWSTLASRSSVSKQRGLRGNLLNISERRKILAAGLAAADRILAPSRFVRDKFNTLTEQRVDLLRHGHDLSWRPADGSKTPARKIRFGYIGQIKAIKGVHLLVEAFHQLPSYHTAQLDIWGSLTLDRPYVQHLRQLVNDSASIKLHGRFSREKLAEVLANIDVLIVPSLWYENAPLTIQEAFAVKTPVIATDLGGMAEAVTHEVNGLLFERGNVVDLKGQMQRLMGEDGLIEKLTGGIPEVKTVAEEVRELEMIYEQVRTGRGQTTRHSEQGAAE